MRKPAERSAGFLVRPLQRLAAMAKAASVTAWHPFLFKCVGLTVVTSLFILILHLNDCSHIQKVRNGRTKQEINRGRLRDRVRRRTQSEARTARDEAGSGSDYAGRDLQAAW